MSAPCCVCQIAAYATANPPPEADRVASIAIASLCSFLLLGVGRMVRTLCPEHGARFRRMVAASVASTAVRQGGGEPS